MRFVDATITLSAGPGGATIPISHTLKDYLDREYAQYDVWPHPEAFRAARSPRRSIPRKWNGRRS